MSLEFEKSMKKINSYLKLLGMSINKEDSNRTLLQRLKYHWLCSVNIFSFNLGNIGQVIWLVWGIATKKSLLQLTFLLPCITLCLLGNFKIICFIYYAKHVNDLIETLRHMQAIERSNEMFENITKSRLKFLANVVKLLALLCACGTFAFAVGPFVIMASYYYTTNKFELFLPFIVWYPFDAFHLRNWPFTYFHQMWCAWVAVFSVLGPDCFFFTCCTFIILQFLYLNRDIEQIVKDSCQNKNISSIETFKVGFVELVNHHRELMRCVELLDTVYSKSTLFNVVSSSLVICATGFNLLALQNYALMAPFISFLVFGMLQIFFYCYYGDYVMRSSLAVGDAIYNSNWYKAGVTERKYLLFVLLRSQKPCKLRAYLFMDINLMAFRRILSTSWSYFALLNQVYQN